jgi:hypothetical protein
MGKKSNGHRLVYGGGLFFSTAECKELAGLSNGRSAAVYRRKASMNREQRRRSKKTQSKGSIKSTLEGAVSNHATVMVANQPPWTPFVRSKERVRDGAELWENSRYIAAVYPDKRPHEGFPRVLHISFKHRLNIAITDFRDMQEIKNALVHKEAMAIQIFPAESQLVDMANQFHLWVFVPDCWPQIPANKEEWPWLPVGFQDGRLVSKLAPKGGRQRTFEPHNAPTGPDEKRVANVKKQNNL